MNLTSLLLPEDLIVVNQLITSYLEAWNGHDTDAFVDHFSEFAEFTDSTGQVAIGRPAIERLIGFQFEVTGATARINFDELYLRYLQPELVIGTGKWSFLNGQTDKPARSGVVGIVHIVFSKQHDTGWKIIFVHSLDRSNPYLK